MTDETLLTAAKLREQIRDRLDGLENVHGHAGIVDDADDRHVYSFVEDAIDAGDVDGAASFAGTELGETTRAKQTTDRLTRAVSEGNASAMAHLGGVTETDIEASSFSYVNEVLDRVRNNEAPMFLVGFGLPNTGKTGHVLHDWFRAWRAEYPNGLLVTNMTLDEADAIVTSLAEMVDYCERNADRRKFLFIDEGSTHFDARRNSREVAMQFSPFSKRFAKLSVDFATIGHTCKDVHPELKRQATTFFEKPAKKQVQFYESIDDDELDDAVFPDVVDGLEKPTIDYDPDDWSPLGWDLDPDRFVEV